MHSENKKGKKKKKKKTKLGKMVGPNELDNQSGPNEPNPT
jgi:hypothetical protein